MAAPREPSPRSQAKTKVAAPALPEIGFRTIAAWSAWLAKHHASSPGFWMRIARKTSRTPSISYAEALEVALAWGWIDGQKARGDAEAWLQKFTPRSPRSVWSQINVAKANALIARGEMQPAGLVAVERAKQSGAWDRAYASPSKVEVPADFLAALAARPPAQRFFEQLESANRYAILFRIHTAKRPETRARRIAALADLCARGERLHAPK